MGAYAGVDADEWSGPRLEETKRVARLIRLAALLTTQPRRWTRAALAGHFEIGERQIARDLDLLRGLGYAIAHTRDGYAFENAPVLPALTLTMPEALALVLAAGLARDAGDVDTATLGAALARLEALVPPDALALLRHELANGASGAAARRAAILQVVQQAQLQRRQARIVYATGSRGGAISERVIEPYQLQRHGRFWIVTAHDHLRGEVRDFKINRIHAIALLDGTYAIPADFDMARYRGATWGLLRGTGDEPQAVELLFTAEAGRWAEEEDWDTPMSFEPRPDGHTLARLTTAITPDFIRWVLWFGPDCQVLAPDSLRQRVCESAEQMVEIYAREVAGNQP